MSEQLELGQKVKIKATTRKTHVGNSTRWQRTELKEEKIGLWIGKRTVYEGAWQERSKLDEDTGRYYVDWRWERDNNIEVHLVVWSKHRNPVYVLSSDLESEDTNG
jgi:hypothetical protein